MSPITYSKQAVTESNQIIRAVRSVVTRMLVNANEVNMHESRDPESYLGGMAYELAEQRNRIQKLRDDLPSDGSCINPRVGRLALDRATFYIDAQIQEMREKDPSGQFFVPGIISYRIGESASMAEAWLGEFVTGLGGTLDGQLSEEDEARRQSIARATDSTCEDLDQPGMGFVNVHAFASSVHDDVYEASMIMPYAPQPEHVERLAQFGIEVTGLEKVDEGSHVSRMTCRGFVDPDLVSDVPHGYWGTDVEYLVEERGLDTGLPWLRRAVEAGHSSIGEENFGRTEPDDSDIAEIFYERGYRGAFPPGTGAEKAAVKEILQR